MNRHERRKQNAQHGDDELAEYASEGLDAMGQKWDAEQWRQDRRDAQT
jgi:hypothetical protein